MLEWLAGSPLGWLMGGPLSDPFWTSVYETWRVLVPAEMPDGWDLA